MLKKLLCASLLLWAPLSVAFAQESLLIGTGDKLHIQVFDTPEMEQHPKVTDAGTIPLMMLGDLRVAGLTPAQAASAIQNALVKKQVMLHPQVTVTLDDNESGEVYVMGQVKAPGAYEIQTATSIVKILALSGGLTDLGDRHVLIQRRGDPNERVSYFLTNDSKKAFDSSVKVFPGDTVLVPKVGIVYVLGDVGKPGGFPMGGNESDMTVLQALALAGTANKASVLSKAKLLRKTDHGLTEVPMKLAAMQKGDAPDIPMQADDVLYIPSSLLKNLAVNGSQIVAAVGSSAIYAHP